MLKSNIQKEKIQKKGDRENKLKCIATGLSIQFIEYSTLLLSFIEIGLFYFSDSIHLHFMRNGKSFLSYSKELKRNAKEQTLNSLLSLSNGIQVSKCFKYKWIPTKKNKLVTCKVPSNGRRVDADRRNLLALEVFSTVFVCVLIVMLVKVFCQNYKIIQ